jgi:cell division septum initiation protein DivIVA
MARLEMPGDDTENGVASSAPTEGETTAVTPPREDNRPARRLPSSRVSSAERERLLDDARDVDFPIALRGYERAAVDRHVEQLNRLIAELEMSSSPESAVRHALDEVSEETRDLLQRAHATSEDITARSRAKADDRLQLAEREAQEVREGAQREAQETREAAQREGQEVREESAREAQSLRETAQRETTELREATTREVTELRETATRDAQQMRATAQAEAEELRANARRDADQMLEAAETRTRELARNAETIWRERRRLLDDMRAVGDQLVAIGDAEAKRFPRLPDEASLGAEPGATSHETVAEEPAPTQEAVET